MRHSLTDKNVQLQTAVCAVCGPTKLKIRVDRSPQCYNAWSSQKGERKKPEKGWPKTARKNHTFTYVYDGGKTFIKRHVRDKLFEESNRACSICQIELTLDTAQYDHCHKNGDFRGWLCGDCNRGLGCFKDNRDSLQKAIDYLNGI